MSTKLGAAMNSADMEYYHRLVNENLQRRQEQEYKRHLEDYMNEKKIGVDLAFGPEKTSKVTKKSINRKLLLLAA